MRYVRLFSRLTIGFIKGLAYVALCLSALAMLAVFVAPQVAGVRFASVLSDSMSPSLATGDMIVVRSVNPEQIEVGDIILFHEPADRSTGIVHRVAEIVGSGDAPAFVTKGDANEAVDHKPVPASRVLGTVQFRLPLLGYVSRELREPWVFLLAMAVPGSLVIASEASNIRGALKRGKSAELGVNVGRDA